nr:hypothetical protein CFP56_64563 [Quercus suber]
MDGGGDKGDLVGRQMDDAATTGFAEIWWLEGWIWGERGKGRRRREESGRRRRWKSALVLSSAELFSSQARKRGIDHRPLIVSCV